MSMKKKNKEMLKKIYVEEYAKAEKKESKAALNRQIANIRKKAQADAKRKYNKAKVRGERAKQMGKKFAKRAKRIQKASEGLLDFPGF